MTTEVKTYKNDLSYFSYHSSKNLLDWNVYELENGKGVHKTPLECSARNKDGVREVFETATRAALQMKKKRKKKFCILI